jgi:uncharacterized protein (TIGR03435 family)
MPERAAHRFTVNRRFFLTAAFVAIAASPLSGQSNPAQNTPRTPDTGTKPLAFDVVSIKPNKSGDRGGATGFKPDGLYAVNMSLMTFLYQGFEPGLVFGFPEWLKSERYNLEAKVAESDLEVYHHASAAERERMLRAVFEDRLQLKEHTEIRELPIFALIVAKNGSKLKVATEEDIQGKNPPPGGANSGGGLYWIYGQAPEEQQIVAQGASMQRLAQYLCFSQGIDRFVVDKTELNGKYNFSLEWAKPNATDSSAPSITTAIQEQLGLKLEPTKGPVEVLVIDHIERPTEN